MNFDDTEAAFRTRSTDELKRARDVFRRFDRPLSQLKLLSSLGRAFLWMPGVKQTIRKFGFDHFYGGENLDQARAAMAALSRNRIRSILDFSVETVATETGMDNTFKEIMNVIQMSAKNPDTPFTVFKASGIAREALLQKVSQLIASLSVTEAAATVSVPLDANEQAEWDRVLERVRSLCTAAARSNIKILIDAEHYRVQPAIDWFALHMMREHNQDRPCVYTTIQMYRLGRLDYLTELHTFGRQSGFKPGIKLVRGAYMEEERELAKENGYPDPIQPTLAATHAAFDEALEYCVEHIDDLGLMVATHNEPSLKLLATLLAKHGIRSDDPRIEIAQLMGMRDTASVLLADNGYNVSKYIPYGPIHESFPYLTRRAMENTSVQGQMGRDLQLIETELARRA